MKSKWKLKSISHFYAMDIYAAELWVLLLCKLCEKEEKLKR